MNAHMRKLIDFIDDENGVALTEYLVLLAILVGSTLLAVTTSGQNISDAWNAWADYYLVLAGKAV